MKNLLTIFSICCSFISTAQITFTRSDYGINGDVVNYAVDSPISAAINFGANGPNHNWNFVKARYLKRYDSTLFLSATSDPNAPGVTANLLLRSVANGDQYQEVTSNYIKMIVDMPAYKVTGVKLKMIDFPLNYQNVSTDSTNATARGLLSDFGIKPITGIDSMRIDAKINMIATCDGWGIITLPDSTSYNSLHVTSTITINANIYIHSIIGWALFTNRVQSNTNLIWFAQNSKSYIANVALDSNGNFSSFTYKVNYIPVTIPRGLVSITPDSIMQGQKVNVTIKGRNTYFTQGALTVYIGNCVIDTFQAINDTTITATVSTKISTPVGSNFVEVQDPVVGWMYINSGFRITASPYAPKLVSVSPGFGHGGTAQDITINASRTHFTTGSNAVYITQTSTATGYVYINSFSVINDSVITCHIQIDSNIVGSIFNVNVNSSVDGSLNLYSCYYIVNTGVNELSNTSSLISVYPNPASGSLNITIANTFSLATIELFDLCGRKLKSIITTNNNCIIDVSDLIPGMYFCNIHGSDFALSKKIIIGRQ